MQKVILAAIVVTAMTVGARADEITLKVSDQFPLTHIVSINGPQAFMKRVEELIPGRVKFQHYPAEQLAKAVGQLDAVRNGLVDISVVCTCYIPERVPLSTVAELPGLFDDTVLATKAYMKLTSNDLKKAEYDRYGVRPLFVFLVAPYQLMMRSPKPVTDIAQLNNMKLRVAGAGGDFVARALGGVGVKIPASDLYLALERGTVDGTIFSTPAIWAYKVEEVVSSWTTNAGLGSVGYLAFVKNSTWEKLPPDVQAALQKASDEVSVGLATAYVKSENESYSKLRALGKTVYELSPPMKAEFNKRLATVAEDWVKGMEARKLPGREILEKFRGYMKE